MIEYILLFAGLLLLWFEFFLPGGILATCSTLTLISALVFACTKNTLLNSLIFVFVLIVSVILTIRFALWNIRKSKNKNSFYLEKSQEGFKATFCEESLIGKVGICATDLGPAGYIIVDEKRYSALTQGNYLEKGQRIEILSTQGSYYIVQLKQ